MLANLKTVPLGELAHFEMGQSPDSLFVNDLGYGVPFLQGSGEFGAVTPRHSFYCTRPKKLCEINDVLISVRAPVGTLNKADRVYCIGRGLAAVRFKNGTLPKFGWHLLNYWTNELRKVAQGSTFEAIGKAELENLRVAYLAEDEQCKIADILDALDETIAHTTSIIAKLKQIKAGLLHDLLTRGLDENGELRDAIAHPEQFKDSPMGMIPKDWKIIHIGELGSWSGGATPSKLMASNWHEGNILWISPKDFQEAEITDSEDKITEKALISSSLKLFMPGDVIVVFRSSILRHKFPVAVVKAPFTVNQDIKVLQPNLGICRRYVFFALQHIAPQILSSAVKAGTTVESVDFKTFCNLPLFLPPEPEQERIIQILDIHDTRIRTEETYLEKLKLQKKGLMDDLLTGRVRVNTSQKISA